MATIKRMSRTSKGSSLTEGQRGNLIGGMAGLLTLGADEPQPLFNSEEERRQAWDNNRASLIRETATTERPGTRPDAFWQYDIELAPAENIAMARHEYLIKNNLLFIGELAGIIKEWKRDLKAYNEILKAYYKRHIAGEWKNSKYCIDGNMTAKCWEGMAAKWASEAEIYGPEAVKAWESMKQAIEKDIKG